MGNLLGGILRRVECTILIVHCSALVLSKAKIAKCIVTRFVNLIIVLCVSITAIVSINNLRSAVLLDGIVLITIGFQVLD